MKIKDLKLDYYSDFLGEPEIRFYTNPKNIPFRRNIQKNPDGALSEITLKQGENGIYFFSMWDGFFFFLICELTNHLNPTYLPKFIKDYNECEGWRWDDIDLLINENDLDWSIDNFLITLQRMNEKQKTDWNTNSIVDLIIFLKFVKENEMELRISYK
ncbi:hypothetical protein ASE21_04890 [Flavobacterium sp. Root901]|uniref:hypothetical protein n=1 Tax=Flavobacterium sp. Root901 TaxID=1736605 RepID=UPI00070C45D5|nr:hypothetical protein [Flavobacterium sp. Root901]KRD11058.1 hypothetical protein ASE21_04890 [Flavobacterium sp. Root901]